MHLTFGHPEPNELILFVSQQGASLAVIKAIKALRCAACDRSRKPKRPRPAKLPEVCQTSQPFDRVLLDVFYQEDCRGKTRPFLGVIDDAMLLHTIGRLPNREAEQVWKVFRNIWLIPFGLPLEVVLDLDGSFLGYFEERLNELGVNPIYWPAEAHYQIGRIERHNYVAKLMVNRLTDTLGLCEDEEIDEMAVQVAHAKNSNTRRRGRSPYQAAFGRIPRLATALLSDETQTTTFANVTPGSALAMQESMRIEANKAFFDVESSE